MQYRCLLSALVGVLLAVSPAAATTYVFTWSEFSTGHTTQDGSPVPFGTTTGYGLATVIPSTGEPGAIELTFSGPGGNGRALISAPDASQRANGFVWYPIRGSEQILPASLKWFGDFTDPDNFIIVGFHGSQGGTFHFWGAAAPLTAAFTTVEWGDTVAGAINVGLAAGLANVPLAYELWVDNARIFAQSVVAGTASPSWDTRTVANGPHDLAFAVRHPTTGEVLTSITLPITVNNAGTPPPSPVKVFITQPSSGATVSGTAWVVLWAEGTSGASNVFTLSNSSGTIGTQTTSSRGPVSFPWNTGSVSNGTHTLTGTVLDAAGNTGTTSISANVRN